MAKNVTIGNKTYTGINKIKVRIPNTETYHEFFVIDDGTATENDIVSGKTAYANNRKVVGTYQGVTQPGWEDSTGYTVTIIDNGGTFNLEYITTSGAKPTGTFSSTTINDVYYIKMNGYTYTNPDDQSVTFDGISKAELEAGVVLNSNITLTINSKQSIQQLEAPVVIAYSNTVFYWDAVPNATHYEIYINGVFRYTTTSTSYSVSGACDVSVIATAPGYLSSEMSNIVSMVGCFVKGTLITLADFTQKPVEDITYEDSLLVWNFDNATFDSAKPLWIMKEQQSKSYTRLTFDDNTELNLVGSAGRVHRVYDYDNGQFQYGNYIPLNNRTFKDNKATPKLISIDEIEEPVSYYNIITTYHMNLFANGVLTSCGYNNMYPIEDMAFVKDGRELVTKETYGNIKDKWYDGLRLGEQDLTKRSVNKAHEYISKLEVLDANRH